MTHRPRNIGIVHYQVGRMDGVSLEIVKWKRTLEEMGTRMGRLGNDPLLKARWQGRMKGTWT